MCVSRTLQVYEYVFCDEKKTHSKMRNGTIQVEMGQRAIAEKRNSANAERLNTHGNS